MVDLSNIDKYKENNRLEAKSAKGGLPKSVWETYSAFANTAGGVILLGVTENSDKTLNIVGLKNPEKMIKEFWDNINNIQKVSVNILSDSSVRIEETDGKKIIIISVPRADRADKPVYTDGNPLTGTYRRNGEGDYKCTKDEVQAMLRDASRTSQDLIVLDKMSLDVFDYDSVHRYRQRMKNYRPAHVWEELDDEQFLYKLNAVGRAEDNTLHPTAAGLLMFGLECEIVKEFPDYFLDYREQTDSSVRWTDRIVSTSGEWSGNVYDFYFRVYNKLTQDVKVPFKLSDEGGRIDDTPVHKALREALANCLINADYYGKQGLVIIKEQDKLTFSNQGCFRIDIETAKAGGVSDPRNTVLMKMFNLIDIGERAGSGIPSIFDVWKKNRWKLPEISESFEPPRVTIVVKLPKIKSADKKATVKTDDKKPTTKNSDKKVAIKSSDKKVATKSSDKKVAIKSSDKKLSVKTEAHRKKVIEFLQKNGSAKTPALTAHLGLGDAMVRRILHSMADEGIIIAEGSNRDRVYRLK